MTVAEAPVEPSGAVDAGAAQVRREVLRELRQFQDAS